MGASDYRKIARDNLEGSWWIAIGIGAVAYLLGGMLVGSSFLPEMRASNAITASSKLMNGDKMDLFILDLSFFGWSLLAALTLNLGNLALNPYKNAAYAAFYRDITGMGQYCAPVIE